MQVLDFIKPHSPKLHKNLHKRGLLKIVRYIAKKDDKLPNLTVS